LREPTEGYRRCYRTGERPSFTPRHVLCLRPFRLAILAGLVITAAACNSSSSTSTGIGDLVIIINVPTGGNAAVAVAGPNAYAQTLTATGTLAAIATGTYVITAGPARVSDPIVSQVDTGVLITSSGQSGTSATITLNNNSIDTITVNYGPRPGSGFLWITSTGNNGLNRINGFFSQQLQNFKPTDLPTVSVDGRPGQGAPGPIAVDLSGNLWVATATGVIGQYQYGQLLKGTTAGPSGKQLTVAPNVPLAMAFDPAGNLWVAYGFADSGEVVEYPASSLASGSATALTSITVPSLLAGPAGMAFDNTGNLWVASSASGTLIELTSALLSKTGGSQIAAPFPGAVAPAFDPSGRLWVVTTANTILGFAAEQTSFFTPTTTPSEVVTVTTTGTPTAAAFDNSQDIWITEGASNTLIELTSTQIQNGGTQAPAGTFTPPVPTDLMGLAFNPKGQFLPLAGQHAPPAPSIITSHGVRQVHYGA
jgi:hypothetical protein